MIIRILLAPEIQFHHGVTHQKTFRKADCFSVKPFQTGSDIQIFSFYAVGAVSFHRMDFLGN